MPPASCVLAGSRKQEEAQLSDRRDKPVAWVAAVTGVLGAADLAFAPDHPPLLLGIALIGLATAWSRSRRHVVVLALATVATAATARIHLALIRQAPEARAEAEIATRLEALETLAHALVADTAAGADRVAALPDVRAALGGDAEALTRLFPTLERMRTDSYPPLALAVVSRSQATLAWAGDLRDPVVLSDQLEVPRIFVSVDRTSATLAAVSPVSDASGHVGHAVAQLRLAAHGFGRRAALASLDRLSGDDPRVKVSYLDSRDSGAPEALRGLDTGVATRRSTLRLPDGRPLARVRVHARSADQLERDLLALYRRVASALGCLTLGLWALGGPRRRLRIGFALTAARLLLLALGPPFPSPRSCLLSPETFASAWLGPLLGSPFDLLLTTLWLFLVSSLFAGVLLARAPAQPSGVRLWVADIAAFPVLLAGFAWIADGVRSCNLDLGTSSVLPPSPAHLVLQGALLILLAWVFLLLLVIQAMAGPSVPGARAWLWRGLAWLALWSAALWAISDPSTGLAFAYAGPAIVLYVLAALLGGRQLELRHWLGGLGSGARAGPILAQHDERRTQLLIEQDYAPLVSRQPERRRQVLDATLRYIDAEHVLTAAPGLGSAGLEELAFALWAETDLAHLGFSSAVEIQDATGAAVSRFALNLPTLLDPARPLPEHDSWVVTEERLPLASADRPVVHARRRLTTAGETRGAAHVYVADDYWNLPFLSGRDPYSAFYRQPSDGVLPARPVELIAVDPERGLVFSSLDPAPSLAIAELERALQQEPARWITLELDGRSTRAFVFAGRREIYVLLYATLGAGRYVHDLVETASGLALVAILLLATLVVLRTLLGCTTFSLLSAYRGVIQSFSLRLFVAFIALAVLPAAVLQVIFRGFVFERLRAQTQEQALERAAMAKKAVEDFVLFQKDESPDGEPVTDAALVWVTSVIRDDLDVFDRGRLRASSRRELYASGLLSSRVPGGVFREIVLEGRPWVTRTEQVGDFRYQVAWVRLDLDTGEPGILSLPMAVRQREVDAVLASLDRTIRLASLVFLLLACGLAQSVARRISGPIRALTRASRRIAAGDLEARVTPQSQDELRELMEAFNQMAQDLESQRRDIRRSHRLAAWADMARQVAHEVKNPLTPIQLSAEHLRRVYRDPGADFAPALETCTQTILRQVRSLRGIVTEFSAFARPPSEPPEALDVGDLLRGILRPYQVAPPAGVSLSLDVGRELPVVWGDRRLLERATVNLIENALEAVQEGGVVQVRASQAEAGGVRVEVEDSGPGFDAQTAARAFEPSFSTRTSGSGLGLALVKKIAEDHGGSVAIEPRARGTRIVMWLAPPVRPEPAHAPVRER